MRIHLTEKTLVFSEIQGEIGAPKQEIGPFRQFPVLSPNPGVHEPLPIRMRTGILEFELWAGRKNNLYDWKGLGKRFDFDPKGIF